MSLYFHECFKREEPELASYFKGWNWYCVILATFAWKAKLLNLSKPVGPEDPITRKFNRSIEDTIVVMKSRGRRVIQNGKGIKRASGHYLCLASEAEVMKFRCKKQGQEVCLVRVWTHPPST